MKKIILNAAALFTAICLLSGCSATGKGGTQTESQTASASQSSPETARQTEGEGTMSHILPYLEAQLSSKTTESEEAEKMLQMKIGDTAVAVSWEENGSVEALKKLCENGPLTIQMSMYGGFEQVGRIGQSLPRNDSQTTTQAGDIVLYSGDQLVVFYGSNSWAYTRLGRITDKTAQEMTKLLGGGDVMITLELKR